MNSKKCPECNLVNFPTANFCKKCGFAFEAVPFETEVEPEIVNPAPRPQIVEAVADPAPAQVSEVRIKNKPKQAEILVSMAYMGYMLYLFITFGDFVTSINMANGAPQQAVGAAMALGYAIIPYCGLRAFSEVVRHLQGK